MPTLTKKFHGDQGKLVIINLQPTKQDKKAGNDFKQQFNDTNIKANSVYISLSKAALRYSRFWLFADQNTANKEGTNTVLALFIPKVVVLVFDSVGNLTLQKALTSIFRSILKLFMKLFLDLLIRTFADSVMEKLFEKLGLDIPDYNPERDPIVSVKSLDFLDWTQSDEETKRVVALAEKVEAEFKERKKLNKGTKKVEPKKAEPVAKPVKERTIPKKGARKAKLDAKSVEPLKAESANGNLESLKSEDDSEIKTEVKSSDLALKEEAKIVGL